MRDHLETHHMAKKDLFNRAVGHDVILFTKTEKMEGVVIEVDTLNICLAESKKDEDTFVIPKRTIEKMHIRPSDWSILDNP